MAYLAPLVVALCGLTCLLTSSIYLGGGGGGWWLHKQQANGGGEPLWVSEDGTSSGLKGSVDGGGGGTHSGGVAGGDLQSAVAGPNARELQLEVAGVGNGPILSVSEQRRPLNALFCASIPQQLVAMAVF